MLPPRANHRARDMPRDQHRAARVDGHHAVEFVGRRVDRRGKARHARAIDQPVERIAHPFAGKRRAHRRIAADVELERLAARFVREPLELARVARGGDDARAAAAQRDGRGAADAARCARHEKRPAVEIESDAHDVCNPCMKGWSAG